MYEQDANHPGVYWLTSINGEKAVLDLRNCTKLAVGISGGADSTSLLYLLGRLIKDEGLNITLTPHTFLHHGKPWNPAVAKRAAEKVQELLGVTFEEHVFKDFGPQGPTQEIKQVFVDKFNLFTRELTTGPTKQFDRYYGATTANPNFGVLREHPDCDTARNVAYFEPTISPDGLISVNVNQTASPNMSPYKYVDKKMTATVYVTYGLGESLLPYTRSCELLAEQTKNFQHNCSTANFQHNNAKDNGSGKDYYVCWWCQEREWAFEGTGIDANAWIPLPEMTDEGYTCPIFGVQPKLSAILHNPTYEPA